MAGTAKKWFIGCGIGCGLFLLVLAIGGTVAFFGIRKAVDHGKEIESGFEELRTVYGEPEDFAPEPDGAVPYDRMEAFLAVRDAMAADRKEAGDILRALDGVEVDGEKPGVVQKIKAGINLIPTMMTFIHHRNGALLNGGMGLGEYVYIYSLSYYNLLNKDLADGPSFQITGDDEGGEQNSFHWEAGVRSEGSKDELEKRSKAVRTFLHRVQLQMARNQLEKLDGRGGFEESRTLLLGEIGLMEDEPLRLLWETGLPEAVRSSLEPFQDRLEASYDPMVNVLESGLVEND